MRYCLTDVENAQQDGQAAPVGSSMTTWTVRAPSSSMLTVSTATPGRPNRSVVAFRMLAGAQEQRRHPSATSRSPGGGRDSAAASLIHLVLQGPDPSPLPPRRGG